MIIALTAGAAVAALAVAVAQTVSILRADQGTDRMRAVAGAIREGTAAFLRREYSVVLIVAFVIAVVIAVWAPLAAIGFVLGAVGSAVAGLLGVLVSARANVRTAATARKGDLPATLRFAFRAGSVTGLGVVGLATLELVGILVLFRGDVVATTGVLVGASLISLFARVGGGIYTKGADVGADLVGKLETQIPEDDPRNPAVIADNVGDNVGDCAGMAADLFETFLVTAVAAMLLGPHAGIDGATVFPVAVCGIGIVATLIGSAFVRMSKRGTIMGGLYRGLAVTLVLAAEGEYLILHAHRGVLIAAWVGLAVVIALVALTDHYTSLRARPVARIADAADAGAGPVVITGMSLGLRSVAVPGVVIAAAILIAYEAAGLYGIGMAGASMLAVMGMIISIDAFGPITDNAGGIAEMSALPPETRVITDALDAVGNTTKAITKGYAIGSAALGALSLFAAYTFAVADRLHVSWEELADRLTIQSPVVVVGLLIGALLPFFFTSFLMSSVSVAAQAVVVEVRRQFREIRGLVEGTARPDYARCVAIVTTAALRQLVVPGLLAVAAPLAVGLLLGPLAVAGMLLGTVLSGFPLALVMTTSGAAWDNAKKYVESGHHGGKHSPADAAAIVGDTVGDATKDAAGPAINPLVKVVNTVALLCVGLVVR
jgi:K(+)-stimulated pyrophosphate-energized sodium pump